MRTVIPLLLVLTSCSLLEPPPRSNYRPPAAIVKVAPCPLCDAQARCVNALAYCCDPSCGLSTARVPYRQWNTLRRVP